MLDSITLSSDRAPAAVTPRCRRADGEDSGICADADRQSQDHDRGKARLANNGPHGVSNVVSHGSDSL